MAGNAVNVLLTPTLERNGAEGAKVDISCDAQTIWGVCDCFEHVEQIEDEGTGFDFSRAPPFSAVGQLLGKGAPCCGHDMGPALTGLVNFRTWRVLSPRCPKRVIWTHIPSCSQTRGPDVRHS